MSETRDSIVCENGYPVIGPLITERECVERERAAFVSGWMEREDPRVFGTSREWAVEEAARRYPLPKEASREE